MIQINPKSLSGPKAKAMGEWLRDPRAHEFITFLSDKAAQKTAEAGNYLLENTDVDNVRANECADEARNLMIAIHYLRNYAAFDAEFHCATLTTQYQTNPQTEE